MNKRLLLTRLLFVPVAFLVLVSHHVYVENSIWDGLLSMSGLVLLLAAMGGRIWASAHLVGNKNRVLITGGPYAFVRNPLYGFSLLGFVGAGLAFESVALAALFGLIFLVGHLPAVHREEAHLAELFGQDYEAYKERVPRLFPRIRGGGAPRARQQTLDLDTRRFRKALRDCLAIPLVFVFAELLEWAKLSGILPVLLELP
jgi:protein-S-isoprenylcysteine O-methyltransferase Ste14